MPRCAPSSSMPHHQRDRGDHQRGDKPGYERDGEHQRDRQRTRQQHRARRTVPQWAVRFSCRTCDLLPGTRPSPPIAAAKRTASGMPKPSISKARALRPRAQQGGQEGHEQIGKKGCPGATPGGPGRCAQLVQSAQMRPCKTAPGRARPNRNSGTRPSHDGCVYPVRGSNPALGAA